MQHLTNPVRCCRYVYHELRVEECSDIFVLYYKALAEEKFKWPKASDELMSLSGEQINWLLDG